MPGNLHGREEDRAEGGEERVGPREVRPLPRGAACPAARRTSEKHACFAGIFWLADEDFTLGYIRMIFRVITEENAPSLVRFLRHERLKQLALTVSPAMLQAMSDIPANAPQLTAQYLGAAEI